MAESQGIESFIKKPKRKATKLTKHLRRKKKKKTRKSVDHYRQTIDSISNAIK